jgi:hypothetical protein
VKRIVVLALVALVAGGCGKSRSVPKAAPDPAQAVGAGATTLYHGSEWAVVTRREHAWALHLAGGRWRVDRSGRVAIRILGPQPGGHAAPMPQVAVELVAPTRLVDSALWVDGTELQTKGGGSPTRGTIYGAPSATLARGKHVAVGYARTATTASVVAWSFTV